MIKKMMVKKKLSKKRFSKNDRKGNKFSLSGGYKKSFSYIKDSKDFIYSAILLFFIFGVIGLFFQDLVNLFFSSVLGIPLNEKIFDFIQKLWEQTQGKSHFDLISYIFLNNLQGSFIGLMLGIFLGIPTLIATVLNGYLLGFVAFFSIQESGVFVLWRLLPHGVFELPAIFISLGLGFRLGLFPFINKKSDSFFESVIESLRVFLFVILPLLVIAAIIEGTLIFLGS